MLRLRMDQHTTLRFAWGAPADLTRLPRAATRKPSQQQQGWLGKASPSTAWSIWQDTYVRGVAAER